GLDDDCDGNADDLAACPGATSCVEGGCRLPCAEGEFPCQGGFVCVDGSAGRFCVPSACATCQPNEICQNNQCLDPCIGVTCNAPKTCRFGTCVDCNITGCPTDQVCNQSLCVPDPCAGVDCAATCQDPRGCSCLAGACVGNCDDTDCAEGEQCAPDGSCLPNLCAGVTCGVDERCVNGQCTTSTCGGIGCGPGEVCEAGTCVDDPCKLVTCSEQFTCNVRNDVAICQPKNPLLPPERVTAAGGGCATNHHGSNGALLVIAMALLGLRRRRSAVNQGHNLRALAVAVAIVGTAAACNLSPYDLNKATPTGDANDNGDGNGDGGGDAPLFDAPSCVVSGPDDTCDEIDNDCNGIVDDTFNKQLDDNNCGLCGKRCTASGAVLDCVAGACEFLSCQPGFADLDADGLTCEYRCPLFPGIAEDCNGVDDDCDGRIDETLPTPPTGQCRTTPNTPCAGTVMTCATRNSQTRWFCDYGPDVEFDPSIPNGIALAEQQCDGKDGDCDAIADDTFTDLGQECDDGGLGVCRDVGKRICDPADLATTKCDLTVLPDAQAASAELCDGLDNDCNGTADDTSGPSRVIDAMTHIQIGMLDYYIDTYEAAHPDATIMRSGVATTRACSNAGVLPWRGASFAAATAACTAANKVLCSASQWQTACEGATNTDYPYSSIFVADRCNTESNDGVAGGADDDILLATGAKAMCMSSDGAMDMSGNLKEWTNEITGTTSGGISIAVLRGGAYDSPALGATCDFRSTRAAINVVLPTVGFRCCKASAP
nr:SUMF1/EgtB/PvdO family nonheme iron enzyme [Kofleriaceae bacterium]